MNWSKIAFVLGLLWACVAFTEGCSKKIIRVEQDPVVQAPSPTRQAPVIEAPAVQLPPLAGTIYFEFNSSVLSPESFLKIDQIIQELGGRTLFITGGACPIGSEEYNASLGWSRARTVEAYVSERLAVDMVIRSVGEDLCCLVTTDPRRYELNRRVELRAE